MMRPGNVARDGQGLWAWHFMVSNVGPGHSRTWTRAVQRLEDDGLSEQAMMNVWHKDRSCSRPY